MSINNFDLFLVDWTQFLRKLRRYDPRNNGSGDLPEEERVRIPDPEGRVAVADQESRIGFTVSEIWWVPENDNIWSDSIGSVNFHFGWGDGIAQR